MAVGEEKEMKGGEKGERKNIPLLHQLLEPQGVSLHHLLCLIKSQLNWIVSPTKWVVQAGLVGAQTHQQLPRMFVLHGQSLPAHNSSKAYHLIW